MKFANVVKKISDSIDKVCLAIIVAILGTMVVVTMAQIISRLAGDAFLWTEELNRYLLIWGTLIGAGCAYKEGSHISITFVQGMCSAKTERILRMLVHTVCLIAFVAMAYFSLEYAMKQAQLAPVLRIPMKYMYLSIPIGFSLMAIHALDALLQVVHEKGGRL
jgi:TRAP-type C4-dicarboxylate transport system permease small subunit